MKIGDRYLYIGQLYEVERIDPDKTWVENIWERLTNNHCSIYIVFKNVNHPEKRIWFNKESFNEQDKYLMKV